MATPSTKATLKSYCLRALGFGVIDINVSDDQTDDRLDEALQYFAQYHYDGIEKMYLKHLITSDDVTRARSDASTTATDTADSSITATWKEGKNFIPIPNSVVSVVQVFPFTNTGAGSNMFDIRYQLRLNDLFDFSSTSVIQYEMTMQNIDIYLKRYATALIKKQWGANLSKFKGITMLGGVEMDGETLYSQALEEQNKLEEEIQLAFELPINYMVG